MKYFIDTAEQSEINKWKNYVVGVTSNPSLLEKANTTPKEFFNKNEYNFDNIFIQVNDLEYVKSMIESRAYWKNLIVKVPLLVTNGFNGFELLKDLSKMNVRTCATIVYDINQFNFACECECEFSIALYAKNSNDWFVEECSELKSKNNYHTKIVAASFREAEHVLECINQGADYSTIPPKIMEELFSNENAVLDYNKFYGIEQ